MSRLTLERCESTVIDWMSSLDNQKDSDVLLAPSEHENTAVHRVGLAGLVAAAAWYGAFVMDGITLAAWQMLTRSFGSAVFYGLPLLSLAIGFASLLIIKTCLPLARFIVPALCFLIWPSFAVLTVRANPGVAFIPIGFVTGTATLAMVPRWERLQALEKNALVLIEKLLLFSLPAVALSVNHALSNQNDFDFNSVAWFFAGLSSLCSYMVWDRFSFMTRYLTALREPDDQEGLRSSLIVMSCFWLWPLWIVDKYGWVVTGGAVRK